jgi:integrase
VDRRPAADLQPVKTPAAKDRWITKDEAKALLAGCREPHMRVFIMLGLMTAARTGAILEARWTQVDWERRVLSFGKGHGNKRRAIVPLNPELLLTLRGARTLACSDYIVEFRGERVRTVKTGFAAACRRAELKDVTPHVLRHTAATWAVMDGVPLSQVARMLGDSEAVVEKVYAKHAPEFLRQATAALQLQGKS